MSTLVGPRAALAASPPVLQANAASVSANENTLAQLSGTYSDPDGDAVALSASEGHVDANDTGIGTWRWSFPAKDGPYASTVTLTATDVTGASTSIEFAFTINNVAPSAWIEGPALVPVQSKSPRYFRWSAVDAPDDTLTTNVDCGSGSAVSQGDTSTNGIKYTLCSFSVAGTTSVGVKSTDDDGATTSVRIPTRATTQVKSVADGHLVIDGAPTGDWAGGTAAAVDLTGDGKAEVAVAMGRPAGYGEGTSPRVVEIVLGRATGGALNLGTLPDAAGFRLIGTGNDEVGSSMAPAGDVNGDGRSDLIIGAPLASPHDRESAGAAYVVYGSTSTADVHLGRMPPSRGFRIAGAAAGDRAARAVAGVGDVNGDGYDDIAVVAPTTFSAFDTATSVILGGPAIASVDLATMTPTQGFRIYLGRLDIMHGSVAGGDVNGDGRSDVVVAGDWVGSPAVVVYGTPHPVNVDGDAMGSSVGFRVRAGSQQQIHSVAAGDMDGDGYADIALGHDGTQYDPAPWQVSVVRGGKTNPSIEALGTAPAARVIRVLGTDHDLGYALAMGDYRRDGRMELILGAESAEHNGDLSGSAYVVYGKSSLTNVNLATLSPAWLRIDGDGEYVQGGASVAAGDVTGDGVVDIVVGSPGYPTLDAAASGRVGIFAGSRSESTAPKATAPTHSLPTDVGLTSSRPAVKLAWTGSDVGSGVATYELAQSTNGGSWATVEKAVSSSLARRVLAPGSTYRFRVRATDKAGNVSSWAYGVTFRLSAFQETSSALSYSGTWSAASSTSYWAGAVRRSSTAGSRATLTFTGNAVSLVAPTGPTRGVGQVYVNGSYVGTVSLYSSTTRATRVIKSWRWSTSATRTVSVRVAGTAGHPRVDVDGFVVIR